MTENREPWALNIVRCDNGFSVSDYNGEMAVFEEDEDCPLSTDPLCVCRMLWHIVEYFGGVGSKHDAERISISVIKRNGEEWEEPDDDDDLLGPFEGVISEDGKREEEEDDKRPEKGKRSDTPKG